MAKSDKAVKSSKASKRGRPAKSEKPSVPPSKKANGSSGPSSDALLGFEATLWQSADKLRNNMDAAEYKHVVLGLIFLKYISDAFEEKHAALEADKKSGADPEDKDEYSAENIFWVPKKARWSHLLGLAKQPTIGKDLDNAMLAIEADNPTLKGVLPKEFARPALDKQRLGELIDLIGTIGLGDKANRSRDVLGRVYEYFLGQFASAEGKKGGQFYTPRCVVRVLVEMLAPYKGRVFDPCCGSGGMFVQSEKFVEAHGGRIGDVSIYGQESNHTTWRLAKLNLAIRGIDANIAWNEAGSFRQDAHKDLKADYVIANPPFNDSDWSGENLREDVRWKYGVPPVGNANFAWVQHFLHHLSPRGIAGFVLANGSMSSQQSGEGEIRKALVTSDLVDCMVALPGQLFYSTQIPVCLWFLARDKKNGLGARGNKMRNREHETLFIDARKLGTLIDRVHRDLSDEDIAKIADTYHRWRGDEKGKYEDIPGFCKSATTKEIESHQFVLTPGRYVGAEEVEDDGIDFDTKMKGLVKQLEEQFAEGARLNETLEAMARALFKSWFVDFDPVRAKAAGKQPSGMDAETAKLFPSRFVQSELGEVPEGWTCVAVAELAKISSGKRPSTRVDTPSAAVPIPLYGGGGIMAFVPEPLVSAPVILTGRVGTLGLVFRVTRPCWPSSRTSMMPTGWVTSRFQSSLPILLRRPMRTSRHCGKSSGF
jgi:type I restriction enzyme M protein